jgi:phospholipid/cholesterol/gamma-HCH transport system ATP-binding protein
MRAASPEASAIILEDVRIGFEDREVLRGVSFSVSRNETLALLGESGSGKTLLLKIVAGLLRPDGGRVTVLGREITSMPEHELLEFRHELGFVFQEGALFDSLSVEENVAYRLREEALGEEEIEARVMETLRFVEMQEAMGKLPGELSGGMRRRVAIARALVSRPPIVLYDSPTAGLDPVTSQTIITLILRLRDLYGVTALLATQRLQDAFALANFRFAADSGNVVRLPPDGLRARVLENGTSRPSTRFLFLREGQVYFEGSQEEVLASKDGYLQRFLV